MKTLVTIFAICSLLFSCSEEEITPMSSEFEASKSSCSYLLLELKKINSDISVYSKIGDTEMVRKLTDRKDQIVLLRTLNCN